MRFAFLIVWTCGWLVFEGVIIASLLGANIKWRGGTPSDAVLWAYLAIWSLGGVWVFRSMLRWARGDC